MSVRGIKANAQVKFKLRSTREIDEDVSDELMLGLIKWVQGVVREIVKPPPTGSPFETGRNRNSVGWMVSPFGDVSFGTLSVSSGGTERANIQTVRDEVVVAIATSSGYGGWLEIGTRFMAARAYIVPNVVRAKSKLDDFLGGIFGTI